MNNGTATLNQYDHLLDDAANVAAIVIRERLRPVDGPRGTFFPATFAGIGQGRKSGYHIDEIGPRASDPQGASRDDIIANRCTVDSVPSQANRLESRLLRYSGTCIPKVTISGSLVGEQALDLLEVGHRVADAVLRYTADNGYQQFRDALSAFVKGDSCPLARLAPTSLVFGHWDSRPGGTKSKARRLVRSEIVAYNVARVTKRSQYWSSIDPEVNEDLGQILKEAKEAASENPETKNPASQLGMTDVPAPESAGGVIAFGKIERTSIIALSGVRSLTALPQVEKSGETGGSPEGNLPADARLTEKAIGTDKQTMDLRRYLFALALASVADTGAWDLREGCILVRNGPSPNGDLKQEEHPITAASVSFTGDEKPFNLPGLADVEKFLKEAANAFFGNGGPEGKTLTFDPEGARAAIDVQRGGADPEPKKKEDFIKVLMALPEFSGKEAELKKKKTADLKELWRAKLAPAAKAEGSGEPKSQPGPTES
jgi:CRISPR-associated protein Csb1